MTRHFSGTAFIVICFFIFLLQLFHVKHLENFSRDFWGKTEYSLFHQGRKGVVVGENGWLFTAEEFSCGPGDFEFIDKTKNFLNGKNIKLAIVLIPAKARVMRYALPPCREKIYDSFLNHNKNISTNLLPLMGEKAWLKTDTHWTPEGARLAAGEIKKITKGIMLRRGRFVSRRGSEKIWVGDLARYVPGVAVPPERFAAMTTEQAGAGLLDDAPAPQAVLVGTSYSAMAEWNFAGFLKEALHTDLLNMSDEGQGPFAVMKKYLESDAFKTAPPKLVVWEIPERYL